MTNGDFVILDLPDLVDTQQLIKVPIHKTMDRINCAKRQRKIMTLCEEIKLLEMSARRVSAASVSHHFRINESTVDERESNIYARVPASKAQMAHSNLVMRILKGWKKRLMFGSRIKQKKMLLS